MPGQGRNQRGNQYLKSKPLPISTREKAGRILDIGERNKPTHGKLIKADGRSFCRSIGVFLGTAPWRGKRLSRVLETC